MADDIGFIYLALNDNQQGLVKVGYTRGSVAKRMKELSAATGVSGTFRAAYFCEVQNPEEVESQLHRQFDYCHEDKEFYRTEWRAVKAAILMMQKKDAARLSEGKSDDDRKRVGKFTLVKWVKAGDADKVQQVLSSGGNPNQADENNSTALMWAAELGHTDIANTLLGDDADPNKVNKDGLTALMVASIAGRSTIAEALLEAGAHANAATKDGLTALKYAVRNCHCDVIPILLANGARARKDDLVKAAEAGDIDVVHALLNNGVHPTEEAWRAAVKHLDVDWDTADEIIHALGKKQEKFICAVREDDLWEVHRLIAEGMDVNMPRPMTMNSAKWNDELGVFIWSSEYTGLPPLTAAVAKRDANLGIIKALLASGARLDTHDQYGRMALMTTDNVEVVKLLLDSGANANAMNKQGRPALMYVLFGGWIEVAKVLLESGANPNATEEDGLTALMVAAAAKYGGSQTNIVAAEILLAAGAHLNATDKQGRTALMYAAFNGKDEIVKFLLASGADPNAADKHGGTALMYAVGTYPPHVKRSFLPEEPSWVEMLLLPSGAGNPKVVKALLAANANLSVVDEQGKTALDWARKGNTKIIRLFTGAA